MSQCGFKMTQHVTIRIRGTYDTTSSDRGACSGFQICSERQGGRIAGEGEEVIHVLDVRTSCYFLITRAETVHASSRLKVKCSYTTTSRSLKYPPVHLHIADSLRHIFDPHIYILKSLGGKLVYHCDSYIYIHPQDSGQKARLPPPQTGWDVP